MLLSKRAIKLDSGKSLPNGRRINQSGNTCWVYDGDTPDTVKIVTFDLVKYDWLQELGTLLSFDIIGQAVFKGYGNVNYKHQFRGVRCDHIVDKITVECELYLLETKRLFPVLPENRSEVNRFVSPYRKLMKGIQFPNDDEKSFWNPPMSFRGSLSWYTIDLMERYIVEDVTRAGWKQDVKDCYHQFIRFLYMWGDDVYCEPAPRQWMVNGKGVPLCMDAFIHIDAAEARHMKANPPRCSRYF